MVKRIRALRSRDRARARVSTGLGVSIVRVIAEAHGGHAELVPGAGGTVRIWLPDRPDTRLGSSQVSSSSRFEGPRLVQLRATQSRSRSAPPPALRRAVRCSWTDWRERTTPTPTRPTSRMGLTGFHRNERLGHRQGGRRDGRRAKHGSRCCPRRIQDSGGTNKRREKDGRMRLPEKVTPHTLRRTFASLARPQAATRIG